MRLAATGFVCSEGGSVASANALLLARLLELGFELDFFSKPTFVDPRPTVGDRKNFRFIDVTNRISDLVRRRVENVPGIGFVACHVDAARYNRLLVRRIHEENGRRNYDLCLWMGDYAVARIPGLRTVSFAQGAPGTDARSIFARRKLIRQIAGSVVWLKWQVLAAIRLSFLGLPAFRNSDHIIVGSSVSKDTLCSQYLIPDERVSTLPYPIDLDLFRPASRSGIKAELSELRVLWLGRVVPRKRLDVFLEGVALAVRRGLNLRVSVVGGMGFIGGYEKLVARFPYPERLRWTRFVRRDEVPDLISSHDVLCQPSEEENFGSSVAEAQACGLPVIVGRSNGNSDYLCKRDVRLSNYSSRTLADALFQVRDQLSLEEWDSWRVSRAHAEDCFSVDKIATRLRSIIEQVANQKTIRNSQQRRGDGFSASLMR